MYVSKNLEPGEANQEGKVVAPVWYPSQQSTIEQTSQQDIVRMRTDNPNVVKVDKSQQTDPFQLEGRKLMVALRTNFKEECMKESSVQTDLTMEGLANFESTLERRSRYKIEREEKKIRERMQTTVSHIEKEKLDLEAVKQIKDLEEWLKKPPTPPQQDTPLTDEGPHSSTWLPTMSTGSDQSEQLNLRQQMPGQCLTRTLQTPPFTSSFFVEDHSQTTNVQKPMPSTGTEFLMVPPPVITPQSRSPRHPLMEPQFLMPTPSIVTPQTRPPVMELPFFEEFRLPTAQFQRYPVVEQPQFLMPAPAVTTTQPRPPVFEEHHLPNTEFQSSPMMQPYLLMPPPSTISHQLRPPPVTEPQISVEHYLPTTTSN